MEEVKRRVEVEQDTRRLDTSSSSATSHLLDPDAEEKCLAEGASCDEESKFGVNKQDWLHTELAIRSNYEVP